MVGAAPSGLRFWLTVDHRTNDSSSVCGICEQYYIKIISQNDDKPKCRQPKRRQTKTSTNRNVDRPKRRQTKTSTNQNIDRPKLRQTETSTKQNVDRPKCQQTNTSTHQNVNTPKRRHSILLYCMLWCSCIFVYVILGMYCMYIRT